VLPSSGRIPRTGLDPGGTTVQERPFSIMPFVIGAVAIAAVLLLVLGGGRKKVAAPAADTGEAANALVQGVSAGGAPAGGTPAVPGSAGAASPSPASAGAASPSPAPAGAPLGPAPAVPAPAVPAPAAPPRPPDIPAATAPSPSSVAADLERALGRERLWSSVQPSGDRVEIRSGSCADPAIGPVIDAARTALRGAGLTRLRCLAQSGAVVFERDL